MEWLSYLPAAVSLIIALGTFYFGAMGLRGTKGTTYLQLLTSALAEVRAKLKERDRDLEDCEQEKRNLRDENQWLRDRLRRRDKEIE